MLHLCMSIAKNAYSSTLTPLILICLDVDTQLPMEDTSLSRVDQRYEHIAFLPGHFTDFKLQWATIEKGAYAIMAIIDRMH